MVGPLFFHAVRAVAELVRGDGGTDPAGAARSGGCDGAVCGVAS